MSIKELYLKALFLTALGLFLVLVIGNIEDHKLYADLIKVLYVAAGALFFTAFSFFAVAYAKMQTATSRKKEYNKKRHR